MCFYFRASKKVSDMLKTKYNMDEKEFQLNQTGVNNGFKHPNTPVITNKLPNQVQFFNWGLIPSWAKDRDIQNSTLNARAETLQEKPSFKNSLQNRCLVFADGFYEWQWLDAKGKQKQPYLITLENEMPFAFAGIWNEWMNPSNGEMLKTYAILTVTADPFMSRIHNSKLRMPWILSEAEEKIYLSGNQCEVSTLHLKATPLSQFVF